MDNISKYNTYKNLYNKICRYAKIKYTKEVFTEQKNDAKKLWLLINSSIGRKCKKGADIPNFFRDNNVIFDNYRDIAGGFNNFFINIGQKLQQKLPASTKSISGYLGVKVPSNFIFNFVDNGDIIEFALNLNPKLVKGWIFIYRSSGYIGSLDLTSLLLN